MKKNQLERLLFFCYKCNPFKQQKQCENAPQNTSCWFAAQNTGCWFAIAMFVMLFWNVGIKTSIKVNVIGCSHKKRRRNSESKVERIISEIKTNGSLQSIDLVCNGIVLINDFEELKNNGRLTWTKNARNSEKKLWGTHEATI